MFLGYRPALELGCKKIPWMQSSIGARMQEDTAAREKLYLRYGVKITRH
jgi:hypothetical protein